MAEWDAALWYDEDLMAPYAPMLFGGPLPPEDFKTVTALGNNLSAMTRAYTQLYSAQILYDFARTQWRNGIEKHANYARSPGRDDSPPRRIHDHACNEWMMFAARGGGLALRNFSEAMKAAEALAKRLDWVKAKIDMSAGRTVRRDFLHRFPDVERLRNSIAHPEIYADLDKDMSVPISVITGDQDSPGRIVLQDSLNGPTYSATIDVKGKEGVVVSYDLTLESVSDLHAMLVAYFNIYRPLETQLS